MNEREFELLKTELNRLQQEVDLLLSRQEKEAEPPLHLVLVLSVSEDKERAIVLTSKCTLLEISVRYDIRDDIKPNLVVGLTRINLKAVKIVESNDHEFMTAVNEIFYERKLGDL